MTYTFSQQIKAVQVARVTIEMVLASRDLLTCLQNALAVIEVTSRDADTRLVKEMKAAIEKATKP